MTDCWDMNAARRNKQISEGIDISHSKVLVPKIVEILKTIDKFPHLSVLEAGCGTGDLSHILSTIVDSVVGIDSSFESISIAKEVAGADTNVTLENIDIETNGKKRPAQFDCAIANMVFQTIDQLALAVASISTTLKDGGTLIFSIPHPCFWSIYRDDVFDVVFSYSKPSFHLLPFTLSKDPEPLPFPVPYFHRPLEFYSSILLDAGFVIKALYEPFPNQEVMAEYQKQWMYPRFIVFCCQKIKRNHDL